MSFRKAVLCACLALACGLPAWAAEPFTVDPVHSSVVFHVKHLNIGHIYGRFNQYSGTFLFDDKNPADSRLEMEVKIDSIDTANADRDKHLKADDYFDAKKYPTMTFKATRMKPTDETHYEVTGDLTIHGVTKPVTVQVERLGTIKDMRTGKPRSGWETSFTVLRSEFGMKTAIPAVSDKVRITVAIEGIQ